MLSDYEEIEFNELLKEKMIEQINLDILGLDINDLTELYELLNGDNSVNELQIELRMEILNNE